VLQVARQERNADEQGARMEKIAIEILDNTWHEPAKREHVLAQVPPTNVRKGVGERRVSLLAGDVNELLPERQWRLLHEVDADTREHDADGELVELAPARLDTIFNYGWSEKPGIGKLGAFGKLHIVAGKVPVGSGVPIRETTVCPGNSEERPYARPEELRSVVYNAALYGLFITVYINRFRRVGNQAAASSQPGRFSRCWNRLCRHFRDRWDLSIGLAQTVQQQCSFPRRVYLALRRIPGDGISGRTEWSRRAGTPVRKWRRPGTIPYETPRFACGDSTSCNGRHSVGEEAHV
jgi:hypothetical protein